MEKLNPFDDESQQTQVLANDSNQHSLWPDFSAVPQGWQKVFGPASRAECISWLELTIKGA